MISNTKNISKEKKITASQHSFTAISSFIGTEIGDPYSHLAEKNPRTAKHVVTLFWSWSPAHSRRSEYRLATDRHRKIWSLYEVTDNPETRKSLCCRVASGEPYKGISAENAAYQLLLSTWNEEINQWDFDPKDFQIDECGLLNENDIDGIIKKLSVRTKQKNNKVLKATDTQSTFQNDPKQIDSRQNQKKNNDEVNYWQKLINLGNPRKLKIESIIEDFVRGDNPIHSVKFGLDHDTWAILKWLFQDPDKVFFALEKLAKRDIKIASVFIEKIMSSGAYASRRFTSPYQPSGGAAHIVGKFIVKDRVIISIYAQNIADQLNIYFPKNLRIEDLPFWGEGYDQKLSLARVKRFNLKN